MRQIAKLILSTATIIWSVGAASADECVFQTEPTGNVAKDILACVTLLKKDNDQLRQQLSEQQAQLNSQQQKIDENPVNQNSSIPSGAVVAFDQPGQCPNGWSPFAEGQGRTIIGASVGMEDNLFRSITLTQRKYRDHGGEEQVRLAPNAIPRHDHSAGSLTAIVNGDFIFADRVNEVAPNGSDSHGVLYDPNQHPTKRTNNFGTHNHPITGSTGENSGGETHNNMPPYIALYYCRKD